MTYLGCIFDSNLSGEGMAIRVLKIKIPKQEAKEQSFHNPQQNLLFQPGYHD